MVAWRETTKIHASEAPNAASAIINKSYVDDIATGGADVPKTKKLSADIDRLLGTGKLCVQL